jgi:8-oxo-dGTP diphosphatase
MTDRTKSTSRRTSMQASASDADERAFLEQYDASAFPHPSVAVDVAAMTTHDGDLHALLVRRGEHPHKGRWALAGGFVGMRESLDDAAARVVKSKAGLPGIFLEQLYTFGAPNRDPRTRILSVAYYALVDAERLRRACAVSEGVVLARIKIAWKGETGGPVQAVSPEGEELPLAFDHADILGLVVKRLRGKLDYTPIGFQLLPTRFTLRQLQDVHEAVLGRRLNKDSFRRSVISKGLVFPTGEMERDVPYRPAELYRYAKSKDA